MRTRCDNGTETGAKKGCSLVGSALGAVCSAVKAQCTADVMSFINDENALRFPTACHYLGGGAPSILDVEMMEGLLAPLQIGHDGLLELEVTERDKYSSVIKMVWCCFCVRYVGEAKLGDKLQCTRNSQLFKLTFRTDVFKRHCSSDHVEK